ncbi:hypothetical protein [Nocardia sp. BMG111209]|uniref:hypothetical protein n=1 Tax=Nocardia sp. BMG111209 TaxID=1160137 RepID=UPI0003A7F695|nr:hypothetical protein [Nocardia sp. BMG111209]
MDPTLIAATIAAGATAGLKDAAAEAVQDAYTRLAHTMSSRYERVDLVAIEADPDSVTRRDALAEQLAAAGAGDDIELGEIVARLAAAVIDAEPSAGATFGVDLARIAAGMLRVGGVDSDGTGVRVRDAQITGDIDIGKVRAGAPEPPHPPEAR